MAVVTVSRVLGSGGDEIAAKVAEGLGYELVDKALIIKVAERAGVSVENAANLDEKYRSRVVEWLRGFIEPRMGKILTDGGVDLDPETYVEYCKTVIEGLAETGNVVIVGRAGQFILRDRDNAFHVRINADRKFRLERLVSSRGVSEREALEMMKKSDNMRKNYMERYLKADWNDMTAYHLIVDSSRLGIDLAASVIVDAVRKFSLSLEYIPGVRDRRKGGDRRRGERRRGDRRAEEVGYSRKEIAHLALREGRPFRSHSRPDRRKGDRRKGGRRASDRAAGGN